MRSGPWKNTSVLHRDSSRTTNLVGKGSLGESVEGVDSNLRNKFRTEESHRMVVVGTRRA